MVLETLLVSALAKNSFVLSIFLHLSLICHDIRYKMGRLDEHFIENHTITPRTKRHNILPDWCLQCVVIIHACKTQECVYILYIQLCIP